MVVVKGGRGCDATNDWERIVMEKDGTIAHYNGPPHPSSPFPPLTSPLPLSPPLSFPLLFLSHTPLSSVTTSLPFPFHIHPPLSSHPFLPSLILYFPFASSVFFPLPTSPPHLSLFYIPLSELKPPPTKLNNSDCNNTIRSKQHQ